MLFLQPVVVDDVSAADRSPAAEVRVVSGARSSSRRGPGPLLAQAGDGSAEPVRDQRADVERADAGRRWPTTTEPGVSGDRQRPAMSPIR